LGALILGTGAQWRELRQKYPPLQTCHRRFRHRVRADKPERVLQMLAEELQARGKFGLEEAFIDATFAGVKTGVSQSGLPNAAMGTRILVLADDHSLPLAVSIESASPHERQLVEGLPRHRAQVYMSDYS